ncbi:MAG: molybdopterin oxidoreductase family protein [Burkholderiales bacterium]|nr:MAG: molybdopterin oxidoreductase family protein [Burkholderiales bacterium]
MNAVTDSAVAEPAAAGGETLVRAACPHDCPDTCAMLVHVRDGVAVRVSGAADHPSTDGVLCTKVARYTERTYHRGRLLHPLRRVGAKGEGRFVRVTWDEALDEIAARLQAIAAVDPQRILPYSYAGTMGLVQREGMASRFFHRLGASLLERTICSTAGNVALAHTLGAGVGTDVERFPDARLILIWGSNSIASNLHFWRLAQQAKRRGAKLVAIDPYRSDTAEKCHEHVALLPGTDAALALAMMHVLIREGLLDHDYIERHTLGFDRLRARALEYPPERAAAICGLASDRIVALAREYGRTRPAAIRLNYGMQRVHGGGNAVRAVACLPALVGAWRDAAGGLLMSSNGHFPLDTVAHVRPDLLPGWPERKPRSINMSCIGDALIGSEPPIDALVVYNSNPVAIAPDSDKVVRGFAREDLFTVVVEQFQTDTADYADYVLPATTQLEHFDLHVSYGHRYVVVNHPAIAPLGEARPNSEIFRALAARMGFDDAPLAASDREVARAALDWSDPRLAGTSFEDLLDRGWVRLRIGADPNAAPFADGGWPTPSGKVEFYSERLERMGIDPVPGFVPPHESAASRPELAQRYPLALISPPARNFLNSSFVNVDSLRATEREPWLDIHPVDAAARAIGEASRVRVHNDRGGFVARARVSDRARPGVVVTPGVWWHKMVPGGRNCNAVTSQRLTDIGGGPTFYDCLVEVSIEADGAAR